MIPVLANVDVLMGTSLSPGLKADGQAEVYYVDYGNNEYTQRDVLKSIKPAFKTLPAQAVQCSLAGKS